MTYRSFDKNTYDQSYDLICQGEEDWNLIEDTMGQSFGSIDIDKSWKFLGVLFENSEIGNFIYGINGETFFELEEYSLTIFSIEDMKRFCTYIEKNNLMNKDIFLNRCKLEDSFSENNFDYYFSSFTKIYNFYSNSVLNEHWVIGEIM